MITIGASRKLSFFSIENQPLLISLVLISPTRWSIKNKANKKVNLFSNIVLLNLRTLMVKAEPISRRIKPILPVLISKKRETKNM
jgi:hypothetical protein